MVRSEPSLSFRVNGLDMPDLFTIKSGPPKTYYTVMKRDFDGGLVAVIAKMALKGGVREKVFLATKFGINFGENVKEVRGDPNYVR